MVPRATHADLHVFQRARRERRTPTKAETKRIAKLEAEQQALQDRLDDDEADVSDEDAQALQDQLDAPGDQLDAIDQLLTVYAPEVLAQAGAVVTVVFFNRMLNGPAGRAVAARVFITAPTAGFQGDA